MERNLIIGIFIFAGLIAILYSILRKTKSEAPAYADILSNKEYKVKGQWDK